MIRFGAVLAVAVLLACAPANAASPARDSGPSVSDRTVSTDFSSHRRHWRHYGWYRGRHYGWRHRYYVHRPVYMRSYRW